MVRLSVSLLVRWLVIPFFQSVNLTNRSLVIILDSSIEMPPPPPCPRPGPRPCPLPHPHLLSTRTHRCSSRTCFLISLFFHYQYLVASPWQPAFVHTGRGFQNIHTFGNFFFEMRVTTLLLQSFQTIGGKSFYKGLNSIGYALKAWNKWCGMQAKTISKF